MSLNPEEIRVFIVDDHPIFLRGIRDTIEEKSSFKIVGQASDGQEALTQINALKPDVVVTDVDMPRMDGLTLAATLRDQNPDYGIVILTLHRDEAHFQRALDFGINAFVPKDELVDELIKGISAAAEGKYHIPPSLFPLMMQRSQEAQRSQRDLTLLDSLTSTERTILKLVAENLTSKEIAARLEISARTVATHRNNISGKLELRGSLPLVNYALLNREVILALSETRSERGL